MEAQYFTFCSLVQWLNILSWVRKVVGGLQSQCYASDELAEDQEVSETLKEKQNIRIS